MEDALYRYTPVWKRTAQGVTVYQCFEIPGRGYTVQSKDSFPPENLTKNLEHSGAQLLQLFMESAPEDRSPLYSSIEEAISGFEEEWSAAPGST
jgi:hypothetical protein